MSTIERPINPDCAYGKHPACSGDAWSAVEYAPVDCCCECHDETKEEN